MANFMPNSKVYIGRVPWDNSYRHTRLFSSASEQANWMTARCTQSLAKENYTYVRQNNSIRVPFNAEQLYTYNYVMYQNANYGSKWFYAFIVECNYVNENCTELVMELDVMQTWHFDYTLKECFVEREHVNNDALFAHLNPEPEMPFASVCQRKETDPAFASPIVVVQTAATPNYEDGLAPWEPDDVPNGNNAVVGGLYCNIVNGCAYYAFDPSAPIEGEYSVWQFIRDMNKSGSAESITNIFQFPSRFLQGAHPSGDGTFTESDSWSKFKVTPGYGVVSIDRTIQMPTTLDGYTPHNRKLYTYPYTYCRMDDNAGHFTELKWELWAETQDLNCHWQVQVPVEPDASAFIIPTNYNGEVQNMENALVFPCTAKCSWVYSSYQNWSAQNHLANVLTGLASAAAVAIPAAKGISAAAAAIGGIKASNIATKANLGRKAVRSRRAMADAVYGETGSAMGDYTGMMLGGLGGLGGLAGTVSRQSMIPNTVRGSANGNSLYGILKMTYNAKVMVPKYEFAEIIDRFFDMYGYQVDIVKTPNRTGRPGWNYVKCQNSCHWGNVPSDDMAQINQIYNSGITFWHVDDIGNYSLNNTLGGA